MVDGQILYAFDDYNPDFSQRYSRVDWEQGKILHFFKTSNVGDKLFDTLVFKNDSGKQIQFVTVQAQDLFLAINIDSDQQIKLVVPHSDSRSFINVGVKFSESELVVRQSADFMYLADPRYPLTFFVSARRENIEIKRPDTYE